jgi:hypothetical protein
MKKATLIDATGYSILKLEPPPPPSRPEPPTQGKQTQRKLIRSDGSNWTGGSRFPFHLIGKSRTLLKKEPPPPTLATALVKELQVSREFSRPNG